MSWVATFLCDELGVYTSNVFSSRCFVAAWKHFGHLQWSRSQILWLKSMSNSSKVSRHRNAQSGPFPCIPSYRNLLLIHTGYRKIICGYLGKMLRHIILQWLRSQCWCWCRRSRKVGGETTWDLGSRGALVYPVETLMCTWSEYYASSRRCSATKRQIAVQRCREPWDGWQDLQRYRTSTLSILSPYTLYFIINSKNIVSLQLPHTSLNWPTTVCQWTWCSGTQISISIRNCRAFWKPRAPVRRSPGGGLLSEDKFAITDSHRTPPSHWRRRRRRYIILTWSPIGTVSSL
jgi:hypothetical protein